MIEDVLDAAFAALILIFTFAVYVIGAVAVTAGVTSVVVLTLRAWGVL